MHIYKFARVKIMFFLLFSVMAFFFFSNDADANIVMKVLAVNPSKEQSQTVPVKAYLPKEVKPENVVDKGDLDIAFDNQQGSYYVFGEYEMKPGEVLERSIEIQDIWEIPVSEISSLRSEVLKFSALLKNTEFAERAAFLANSIESKINYIFENQKDSPVNPERRISDYRENVKTLEGVKADLTLLRSLLSQGKPFPSVAIWRVMLAIVIFLGIMGVVFYFIWQRQVKVVSEDTFFIPGKEEPDFSVSPKSYEAAKDKPVKPADIEDIIKEDDT
jgi:hypothetical protein